MTGVASRKYADGCCRIWYIDRTGKQIFVKGTGNRRESRKWAMTLQTKEHGIGLGILPEPSAEEVHRHDPIDEKFGEYFAWGAAQGGLNGGSWSEIHARNIRVRLTYWKEQLGLKTLGDLPGKLSAAEACTRELQAGHENKEDGHENRKDGHKKKKDGYANSTVNGYIEALKSFSSWCVVREFLPDNPFQKLRPFDGRPVVERRALTWEEAARLLACAPPDRRILYEIILLSGLRANEARQLTLDHLDHKNGGIRLAAAWTKGRRDCLQPQPSWFLERLRVYGRQAVADTLYKEHRTKRLDVPVRPLLFVPQSTARLIDIDLKKAGIEKVTPEGKIDFHALRTTFSTLLDEVGATEKTKEVLMRHAPLTLTSKRYVKARPQLLDEAVDQVAKRLGLTDLYADSMPKPQ